MISRKVLTTLKYVFHQCSRNLGHGELITLEKPAGVPNRKSFLINVMFCATLSSVWHFGTTESSSLKNPFSNS